jgi:tRNA-Thr(GGU) m(6)t(6)A37 methyltransferase TsaA
MRDSDGHEGSDGANRDAGAIRVRARADVLERGRGTFPITVVGVIESSLLTVEQAPKQGLAGAPDAWLEVDGAFARALTGIVAGDELIVVTWLHRACRWVLEVYARDDRTKAIAGVFATRSQHRPNPLGLHRVVVRERVGARLRIGPIEAINGTPVVDIKVVLGDVEA